MRHNSAKRPFIAVSLVAALLLAGCGGSDDAAGGVASTTDDTLATPTTELTVDDTTVDSTAVPTTVTEPPVTEPPVTAPADDDGSCLVGDWMVAEDQMNSFYGAITSTMDAPVSITVVGDAPLSFAADGTYAWAPDFALTLEVVGQRGEGSTGGSITGNWTAVDGVVTTASEVNALTMSITVGGTTMDGSDFGNGLLDSSPINGVTYSCEGPTPVLDFMTGDPAVTVPVTLTPA